MSSLTELKQQMYDLNALQSAASMMEWDQQTYMPRGGAAARAEHLGILSRMHHEQFTNERTGSLIERAKSEAANEDDLALIRVVKRDYDLATKLPTKLVEEKSKLAAEAHEIWVEARKANDFKRFLPYLQRMFEIAREEAEHLGYKDHIYDALLDLYEEGATAADVRRMFETIKAPLVELVRQIKESPNQPDDSILHGEWNVEPQRKFTEMLVQAIGFDFGRGRQDVAPHPFCTGWSIGDIRLTTRYKNYLPSAIMGSLHEAGHGMYEQGSPMEWDRSPLAGGVSLGVHESQSRLWENIVGRSKPFWGRFYGDFITHFPQLAGLELDDWVRMLNKVEPSYIRVEADEVTYNLHILIRFEIECDILTGALEPRDLPDAWNAKYAEYLGVTPRNDAEGCLQDVHWSGGSIGYFPTYSMGNLLSYQIWNAMKKDIPDQDGHMLRGDFGPILKWLQEKIYRQGRKYAPKDLVMRVTSKPMGAEDYLEGIIGKYRGLYGLSA
jgi:carboxypeptidase Taq